MYQDKEVQICDQTWNIKFVESIIGKDGKPKKGIRNFSTKTIYISVTDKDNNKLSEDVLKEVLINAVVPIVAELRSTYQERTGNDPEALDKEAEEKAKSLGIDITPIQEQITEKLQKDGILEPNNEIEGSSH